MQFNDYEVVVLMVGRNDQVSLVRKSFKTENARTKWLDKNNDKIVEVQAFSDPQ